jgi:hypothetical protein
MAYSLAGSVNDWRLRAWEERRRHWSFSRQILQNSATFFWAVA